MPANSGRMSLSRFLYIITISMDVTFDITRTPVMESATPDMRKFALFDSIFIVILPLILNECAYAISLTTPLTDYMLGLV